LELTGCAEPTADAEIIEATTGYFAAWGITDSKLAINSIGRGECRRRYRAAILDYAAAFIADLPAEERAKIEKNPLRLLDSKDPAARAALEGCPRILDYLEPESAAHFDGLQALLSEAAIPFEVDPMIVRGLDYYNDTVFEVTSPHLGAQGSLCGGGRYDGLVEELGGPATPSVGVGIGIERLILVLEALERLPAAPRPDAFVVAASEGEVAWARRWVRDLRQSGLRVEVDIEGKKMKAQFKQADRSGARFAVILGEAEAASGQATVRDLASGDQSSVPLENLARFLGGG
jgi:histidyl-tRNA synthetase